MRVIKSIRYVDVVLKAQQTRKHLRSAPNVLSVYFFLNLKHNHFRDTVQGYDYFHHYGFLNIPLIKRKKKHAIKNVGNAGKMQHSYCIYTQTLHLSDPLVQHLVTSLYSETTSDLHGLRMQLQGVRKPGVSQKCQCRRAQNCPDRHNRVYRFPGQSGIVLQP